MLIFFASRHFLLTPKEIASTGGGIHIVQAQPRAVIRRQLQRPDQTRPTHTRREQIRPDPTRPFETFSKTRQGFEITPIKIISTGGAIPSAWASGWFGLTPNEIISPGGEIRIIKDETRSRNNSERNHFNGRRDTMNPRRDKGSE